MTRQLPGMFFGEIAMGDVHVVFGTGPVGRALIDALIERHLPVRAVCRAPSNLPDGVQTAAGDAANHAFAAAATSDAAAVYQCLSPPYHRWGDLFPPLQRSVVAAAQAADARYVSFENLYMYGDTRGTPLAENLPDAATTRKGRLRAAMAAELKALADAGTLAVATGRASDYFGPRAREQSPLGTRVIGRALTGKSAQVVGDPDQRHSYTYLADIGRMLAILGTDERALGEIWHVPNAPARTTRELVQMIAADIGHDIKVAATPKLILRVLGLFNPVIGELDEMLYEFEQPFVVDGGKFETIFGTSATPLAQSIPATVAWWRSAARQG
jgi:nucleoside-diphosphate-sugar epimerase